MQIGDQSSQVLDVLTQAYNQNILNNTTNPTNTSSIPATEEIQSLDGIDGLLNETNSTTSNIQDVVTLSYDFTQMLNFAQSFSANGNLSELGSAMEQSGILSREEKIGFDILYKYNPSLDSARTQSMLQNMNLSRENVNLLSSVERKVNAVRYLGGF